MLLCPNELFVVRRRLAPAGPTPSQRSFWISALAPPRRSTDVGPAKLIKSLRRSLDHLVGEREQFIRHVEAERLRRPEVYDHLELGRQQHRQTARLLALEDATGIAAS